MKTEADLQTALRNELNQWFPRQCREPYTDFYLYYLETTQEYDGGILIASEAPANSNYKLATPEKIRKACTIDQNFNWIAQGIVRRLPVLSP
jgi:hypothetical protein